MASGNTDTYPGGEVSSSDDSPREEANAAVCEDAEASGAELEAVRAERDALLVEREAARLGATAQLDALGSLALAERETAIGEAALRRRPTTGIDKKFPGGILRVVTRQVSKDEDDRELERRARVPWLLRRLSIHSNRTSTYPRARPRLLFTRETEIRDT